MQSRTIPYFSKADSTQKSYSKCNCNPHTASGNYAHFNSWREDHPVSNHLSLITQCDAAPHPRRRETSTAPLQKPKNSYNRWKPAPSLHQEILQSHFTVCLRLCELQYISTDWLGSISHTLTEYNLLILTNGQAVAICCIKQILYKADTNSQSDQIHG
jgi:hypothetical protein